MLGFFVSNIFAADSLLVAKKFKPKKFKIQLNSNMDLASNCFTNQLYKQIYTGGYLDDALKNKIVSRYSGYNRLGFDLDNEIKLQFKPKRILKSYFKWLELSFANRNHMHIGFSNDALSILMFGNTMFVGKTADLNNLTFNSLKYQQIRLGFASDSNDSLKSKFAFGISVLNGQRNVFFNAPKFNIETDPSGYSITSDINYQISNVPTSTSKFGTNNGLGFSLDIDYKENWNFKDNDRYVNQLHVNLRDLGFIQWNNNSYNLEVDTTFTFRGFNFNSLKDTIQSNFNSDSLNKTYLNYKRNAYSTSLPGYFLIENGIQLNKQHYVGLGIQHRTFAVYRLQYRLNYEYRLLNKNVLGVLLTKGGYNRSGINIYGKFTINKLMQLSIGVNQVQGLILPANSGSLGAYFALSYWF